MLLTVLRFNFASPQGEPRTQSKLLAAALELAQWGEAHGITSISVLNGIVGDAAPGPTPAAAAESLASGKAAPGLAAMGSGAAGSAPR